MTAAALFLGGLILTALLAGVLQSQSISVHPVDLGYVPSAEAQTDHRGWPIRPDRKPAVLPDADRPDIED